MSLFHELKRRRVFQTFVLYIVAAWILIQVAQAAFEAWDIPMQLLRYLWIGLTLMSPMALVIAWRYDITSQGIVRTPPARQGDADDLSLKTSDFLILGALASVFILVALGLFRQAGTDDELWQSIRASDRPGIAVLPFVDLSADSNLGYFGAGVAEALLNELGHITEIDVIARTSSFHFQGTDTSFAEIATALAVDYLVEGSVNREAETVHVIAKLIEAASGKQLWSGSFQGTTDRPFSAQQNIAGSVAGFLEMSIGDPRRHGGTTNFAAYDALLRAGDEDDLDVALMLLDEALAHDPKFAVAMVSKAELYWWLMWANRETPQQAWVMAEPLLQNALAVSDDFGIAHAILGGFQITQNDYESAEASLQRALKINPSDTFALGRLSQLYVRTGRITEGIALQERVVRVDPMQSGQHRMLAARKVAGGDIDGAIESFERAISLDPGNSGTWFQYGSQIRDAKGDLFPFQLMERFQREGREPGEPLARAPRLIRNLGLWFAIIEDYARATKMLYLAQDISDSSWIRLDLAGIALQKGDFDKAWSDAWLALEGMPRNDMLASWAGEIALIRGTGRERVLAHYREYWPELFGDAPVVDGIIPNLALAAAFILREEGDEANATALLDALLTQSGPDSITPAIVLAASGEIEAALDTLEAAATAGASISPNRLLIEFIGNEPRLIELLRPEQEEKARVRTEVNAIIERGNIILPTAENLSP